MKQTMFNLSLVAAFFVLAAGFFAPVYAQESIPDPARVEQARMEEETRAREIERVRRREQGMEEEAPEAEEAAPEQTEKTENVDKAEKNVEPDAGQVLNNDEAVSLASGGCSLVDPVGAGLNSTMNLFLLGAGILVLIVRQGIKS